MIRFVRRWRIAAVYVTLVALMSWGVWTTDQANAERIAKIDKALTTCRGVPKSRPSSFD